MKNKIERAHFSHPLEIRAEGDSEWVIRGYALMYGVKTDLGKYDELIEKGAASDCLADDVRCLLNHDANYILGRTASSTCTIGEDEVGVYYDCKLDRENPDHVAVYSSIKRGDISQSSFAFSIAAGGATMVKGEDGRMVRTITKIGKLYDVSPVTYPAYSTTTVEARAIEQRFEINKESLTENDKAAVMSVIAAYENVGKAIKDAIGKCDDLGLAAILSEQMCGVSWKADWLDYVAEACGLIPEEMDEMEMEEGDNMEEKGLTISQRFKIIELNNQ